MRFPSITNFFKAVGRVLRGLANDEDVLAPPELAEKRREACRRCDRYDPFVNQCDECTCNVTLKSVLLTESCPLRRWKL